MPAQTMLAKIRHLLATHVHPEVDWWSRERLALLVLGIIQARHAAPARIASALDQLGVCDASPESLERRIRRSENDQHLSAELCVHPLARQYLLLGQPQELLLVVDPTTQDDRVVMVTIGIWYRGHCLPLVWTTWPAQVPLEGSGFWLRIACLLDLAAPLLPAGVPVIWLADRAFGSPAFTDLLTRPGWHYVVRIQQATIFRDRCGVECPVVSLVPCPGSRAKRQGQAFKKRGWRSASVVALWGQGYREPLCLVTDLRPRWLVLRIYRRRYGIEALFRTYKSHGWQWEQGQVSDLVHLDHLLVAMALALWLVVVVGNKVAQEILARPATERRHTVPWVGKRSLFTLGLQRWQSMLLGRAPCPLPDRLDGWDARTWEAQITQHHAVPYIFARRLHP